MFSANDGLSSSSSIESSDASLMRPLSPFFESDASDSSDDFFDDKAVRTTSAFSCTKQTADKGNVSTFRARMRVQEESFPADHLLSDKEFARTFRMSSTHFERLLLIAAPALKPKLSWKAINARSFTKYAVLSAPTKLLISSHILAGGLYLDLMRIHKVSYQSVYNSFQQFFCHIASGKDPELRIKFPSTRNELQEKANGFQLLTGNRKELFGCVGALDGLQVRIKIPSRTQVSNVLAYCARNGIFSMNVQAICDPDLRITFLSVETPGATHDNTAFSGTDFASHWHSASENDLFWVACDEAYSSTHNLVTPWPRRSLQGIDHRWKDSFNYVFSGGNRNTIERAFGVVVAKWGIFFEAAGIPS